MILDDKIIIAYEDSNPIFLHPNMANRHGLIAGATGTGKTTTVRVLAESFSKIGVPVFVADVKGDLSGLAQKGEPKSWMQNKVEALNITDYNLQAFPTIFWDLFGDKGHPIRVTISEMGPTLLSRLLNLTDVQEGVLNIVFKAADDQNLEIIDLKDLRMMLQFVGDHKNDYTLRYGNISIQSIGAIQRALLSLENEGGNTFFGEPQLDIKDWIKTNTQGKGFINILNSSTIINTPKIYSTFMLWMLSELYEKLPEVGDLDKPRIVFFFDEAHLLFEDAPKELIKKIVQVVKLIRSKGVGIYFISQSPSDIPDEVLAQLANRVQHALRAYTPSDIKAVKIAAQTFRENPNFKTEDVISQLGVGQALVSFLDEKGIPQVVSKAEIIPPESNDGPADISLVNRVINACEYELKYRDAIDRISAYEVLTEAIKKEEELLLQQQEEKNLEVQRAKQEKELAKLELQKQKQAQKIAAQKNKSIERAVNRATSTATRAVSRNVVNSLTGKKTTSSKKIAERAATNAMNSLINDAGKSIIRGLFGSMR